MEAMNAPIEPLDGLAIEGGLRMVGGGAPATGAGAGVAGAAAKPMVGSSSLNASSSPAHPG